MTVSPNDAHPFPIYNARFRVIFPILDADGDLVTAASTPDSELSQDSGTFADATNEATELATSSGMYYLDLIATEMDTVSTTVIVKTGTAGAKTTPITLHPVRLPVLRTGTAQAGAGTTITLDAGAPAIDDYYNGCYVNITNNSPANALGQARLIIDYVGSTRVATVQAAWGTNPSSASTFEILQAPGVSVNVASWAGTPVDPPSTVGIPDVTVIGMAADTVTASAIAAGAIGASEAPNLDAAISTRATPAQVNTEVLDVLNVDTFAEVGQETPAATQSIRKMLAFLYKAWRNRHTQTATTFSIFADDAVTVDQKATVSDNGTTFDRTEIATGP